MSALPRLAGKGTPSPHKQITGGGLLSRGETSREAALGASQILAGHRSLQKTAGG